MGKPPIDDRMIVDYLLGASTDAQVERFDELSLSDDEFAQRLQAVENDLVDAYVRGELSPNELTRFNSNYLSSPRRQEKVQIAESLLMFADKSVAVGERVTRAGSIEGSKEKVAERERRRFSFFGISSAALQWGFASAALILLLAGGYLLFQNLRLRNQMTEAQAERAALEQRERELQNQLSELRAADTESEKELERVRERLTVLEKLLDERPPEKPESGQRDLKVMAFNLAPQTRAVGQIATLAVPTGTDYVAFTLALEADDSPAYRAALRNPATNQILWRSGRLKTSGQSKTVRVSLRASLFDPQNYVLELSGISATGAADLVSSYPFRVVRQ